jgi:hypothetical protein
MPLYPCYFCNKYFSQKGNLRNHLKKKIKCEFNKYDSQNKPKTEMSHEDVIILFEVGEYHNLFSDINFDSLMSQNGQILTHFDSLMSQNSLNLEITKKKQFRCKLCNKSFTRKNNMKRHIEKKMCIILQNGNIDGFGNNPQIINCNAINNNITTNTQNNITNNTQNNITNNTQNNIHINCYGKEDLSYITKDVLQDIMNQPLTGIPKLIEMIHLNPNHPENNNIKLVNKNLPFLNYYNGEFWKTADKSKVLGNLLKSKTEITDEFYKNSEINMEDTPYPKYSDAIRYVVTNFEFEDPLLKYKPSKKAMTEIYKKLEKDLYTMILNHRDYVKDICEA